MMTTNEQVLVLGASGATGRLVVEALRARQRAVRTLIRNSDKVAELEGLGVEVLLGNVLDEADLRRACTGTRVVISTLGSRTLEDLAEIEAVEHQAMVSLVKVAQETGIEQIVMCSSMGTRTPEKLPALTKVLRAKRRGELALEQSGLPYTIVRPGSLTNAPGGGGVLVRAAIEENGTIARTDVAEVLVQALLQPAARNRAAEIINQAGQGPANRPNLFEEVAV